MKLFRNIILTIVAFILLCIAGLTYLLWGETIATPLDPSPYRVKVLKTGKVDTLSVFTTHYEVGDTVTVFRNKDHTHYSDANDIVNNQSGKTQKAVVVE